MNVNQSPIVSRSTDPLRHRVMNLSIIGPAILLSWSAVLLVASPAVATPYTFTKIAGTDGGVFANLGALPSVNDSGVVAFAGVTVSGSEDKSGIFFGSGGAVTTVAAAGAIVGGETLTAMFGVEPVINNSGAVAFSAGQADANFGNGIYRYDNASTTVVIASFPDPVAAIAGFPSVNSSGRVPFFKFVTGTGGDPGINYVSSGDGTGPTIDVSSGVDVVPTADINDGGILTYSRGPGSSNASIVTAPDGASATETELIDASGIYDGFAGTSINNDGNVVAKAFHDDTSESLILITSGPTITTIASNGTGDAFDSLDSDIALNDSEEVAFVATTPPTGTSFTGIFTGDDEVADLVIGNFFGSDLGGFQVLDLHTSRFSVNASGEIAFHVQLSGGGGEAIYLATPVPEPSSLMLAIAGCLISRMRRRTRR